jgi:hypothetical protein
VLEGMPVVLPTAQKTSWVGNCVKSAVVHEAPVALGEAAEDTADIVRFAIRGFCAVVRMALDIPIRKTYIGYRRRLC